MTTVLEAPAALASAGASSPTLVTPAEVEQFDRDGFMVVRNALPPEKIAALRAVTLRLAEELKNSPRRKDVFGLDVRPIVDKDPAFLDLLEWPATFPRWCGSWGTTICN